MVPQLEEIERRTGKPVAALDEAPTLAPDTARYYGAYADLTYSRQLGWGEGPVPMSEVAAYLALFPDMNAQFLVRAVRALDDVYLEHAAKRAAQRTAKKPDRRTTRGRSTA